MVKQIGGDAAVVWPVLAKAEEVLGVPGNLRRQAPFVAEPHIPVDVILTALVRPRGGVNLLMYVEEARARVAVVAGVRPGDLADAPGLDRFVCLPVAVTAGAVGADLQDLLVTPHGIAQLQGLLDRVRHRLLDVNMLAGCHGVDRNLSVPVVGGGDEHGVDVIAFEQLAVVHVAVALANVLSARDAALVDIADGQHLDIVLVAALDQAADVAGAHAADADHAHVDAVIGAQYLGRRQVHSGKGAGCGGG